MALSMNCNPIHIVVIQLHALSDQPFIYTRETFTLKIVQFRYYRHLAPGSPNDRIGECQRMPALNVKQHTS
jgi:hypothetical protein